ncbi:hypothetical protein QAD02_003708 [Eretmocerus hayati]|uniref:Uncharacterized protein n=1 Tax=Eretmocerus hayati TaxID=131215 RepID=A0ACC2NMX7_9HYME|nr:hypothetical protein QAD02_003708 [Eretmocerus hayati]
MGETVVDCTAFEQKLKTVVESQKGSRVMWDNSYVEKVKNILCGKAEKDHNSYYYLRMYELMQMGSETHVVLKRTKKRKDFVYVVPSEEYLLPEIVGSSSTDWSWWL